ncbi:uncharacterized protein FIBRA_08711 [Fibroporia radiculosa]|uniref:Uncharacterized protein n=1 Tax=Fibroporia radiculosa TaxID=599839 RepID=J4I376_9APHY|nr:uncharacterized protein FIBRA_08711 [Fibroporia radiculosa]CCM06447.1 predicted protein [Fibroporia radiculosa]
MPKAIDISPGGRTMEMHAYPPSLASTSSTTESSLRSPPSLRAKSLSPAPKRSLGSPPPILAARPLFPTKSTSPPSSGLKSSSVSRPLVAPVLEEKDWAAWDDESVDEWEEAGAINGEVVSKIDARTEDGIWTGHAQPIDSVS